MVVETRDDQPPVPAVSAVPLHSVEVARLERELPPLPVVMTPTLRPRAIGAAVTLLVSALLLAPGAAGTFVWNE